MERILRSSFSLREGIFPAMYFFLLLVLAAALPTSRYVMSLAQILMGVLWLVEGNYREKINRFFSQKPVLFFAGIYLLYLAGMFWTQDLTQGINDELKNKLPLLTLSFLIASNKPLSKDQSHLLLMVFMASLLITSFIGLGIFLSGSFINFRDISPFVSHVYLSMMLVMAVFTIPWLVQQINPDKKWVYLSLIVSLWFILFLFILQSLTGLLCLGAAGFFLLGKHILYGKNIISRTIAVLTIAVFFIISIASLAHMYNKVSSDYPPDQNELNTYTALGNPYTHYPESTLRENGYYVYYFIAEKELQKAWNQRSTLDYRGKDKAGNELRSTLLRYLSSKGLRKDSKSLMQLQEDEIIAIESGTPNYLYTQWPGFVVRIHQSIWELYWYRQTQNPSGHTLTQRLELWKGSWQAFKQKPLLGWGTGDIFTAVQSGLESINSKMENTRMKPHNQYLLLLVMMGLTGTVLFFVLYIAYIKQSGAIRFFPYPIFLIIMLVSMTGNNPIDAQTGQTFFTFFTLYFGVIYRKALAKKS